ncbi:MAG: DUF4012 domain-containing protein [Candidatus Woesearchaeota archaeon]|jgi:hypothetical protein
MESESAILIPKIDPVKNDIDLDQKQKVKAKYIVIPSVVLLIILIFSIPVILFANKAKKVYSDLTPIFSASEFADIEKIKSDFNVTKNSITELKSSYGLISWMKLVPFVGTYVKDLGHGLNASTKVLEAGEITFVTLDPFLSELGFKKDNGTESAEKSAQERIDFVVNSIPEILPKADEITKKFEEAEVELLQIDPNKYPENFKGINVREKLKSILLLFEQISSYVSESKPLLESTPYLLGMESDRNYLVLFQNDKELRPTGGFLTAYSVMKVSKAKFEPVSSDDIYNLDAKYKPSFPAPDAIVDLIKGPYVLSQNIRLRDINYSPDYKVAMDLFSTEAEKVGMKGIDGIIAVDTGLLVNLLDALGEIGVPGFGNYSTKIEPKCNCPQVIYELESFADIEGPIIWDPLTGKIILRPANSDNRKKIIGPLMNSILANAFAQPKEKIPALLDSIFKSVLEKHVLFYLFDDKAQMAVEGFGIAGRIEEYAGDYLHINDSNLGGRKSNLYVKQEVEQEISVNKDGMIEKSLTITYQNPEKYDGWLNSVLPNWVRVYVPEGSRLIAVEGLEKQYDTTTELNKTVFSGYFKLRPEGVSKVTFKYLLPFKRGSGDYRMLIQKQPGTNAPLYTVRSSKTEEEFLLNSDKELRIKL